MASQARTLNKTQGYHCFLELPLYRGDIQVLNKHTKSLYKCFKDNETGRWGWRWYTTLDRMARENLAAEMNWTQRTERKRRQSCEDMCCRQRGQLKD